MQKVVELIQTHTYDFFIPLTALALLRLGLCLAQLKKTASIRKKKGVRVRWYALSQFLRGFALLLLTSYFSSLG